MRRAVHTAHACSQHDEKRAEPSGDDVVLLQKSEVLSDDDRKLLDCDCESYKCHCRKQCFCKLLADGFGGNSVPPPPPKETGEPSKPPVPDHSFKCTCSFDGVGGGGLSNGGSMDCDCKVADCACEKQCVCRAKQPATGDA